MNFALEVGKLDLALTLDSAELTLADASEGTVTFPASELGNLLERLRLAQRLYAVTERLSGPLRDEGSPTEPTVIKDRGPAEPPPSPGADEPPAARKALTSSLPGSPGARRPGRGVGGRPRRAAPPEPRATEVQREPAAPSPPATAPRRVEPASHAVPEAVSAAAAPRRAPQAAPRPARAPLAEAPAPSVREEIAAPRLVEETSEGVTWIVRPTVRRRRRHATEAAPPAPPLAATAVPEALLPGPAIPPPAPSTDRAGLPEREAAAQGNPGAPTDRPAAEVTPRATPPAAVQAPSEPAPSAPTSMPSPPPGVRPGMRTPPPLTDVMMHFLKHNGPATLDEAARYVKSLRLWPAAMNLRLSLTIALQKTSFGFVRLPDGRYGLEPRRDDPPR